MPDSERFQEATELVLHIFMERIYMQKKAYKVLKETSTRQIEREKQQGLFCFFKQ